MNDFKGALKLIKAQSNAGLRTLWRDWLPKIIDSKGEPGNDKQYYYWRHLYSGGYSPEEAIAKSESNVNSNVIDSILEADIEASRHLAEAKLELQLLEKLNLGSHAEFINAVINKIEDVQRSLIRWRIEHKKV
jgi:hypothetical protein